MKRIQKYINNRWQNQEQRDAIEDFITGVVCVLVVAALWSLGHLLGYGQ